MVRPTPPTVCPAQLDEEDIELIAQAVSGAQALYLQPFRPVNCLDRSFEAVKPYNPDRMRELCRIAARHVERCMVRGDQASELVAAHSSESPPASPDLTIPPR